MPIGTVKKFTDEKGYGFIVSDEIQGDAFVHFSEIQMEGHKTLVKGQSVDFEVEQTPKGLKATLVKPLTLKEQDGQK